MAKSNLSSNKQNGLWNRLPCEYEFLNIEVRPSLKKTMKCPWHEAFIGQKRQVIRVRTPKGVFFIDNEDGSGAVKMSYGGLWNVFHRQFEPGSVTVLESLPKHKRNLHLDKIKFDEIQQASATYWRKQDPDTFSKINAIKNLLR